MPDMSDIKFGVMDIDAQPNTPIRSEFSVRGIPTCFCIKDGKVTSAKVGMTTESDYIKWVKDNT